MLSIHGREKFDNEINELRSAGNLYNVIARDAIDVMCTSISLPEDMEDLADL